MNLKRFERKTRNDTWKNTKIENYTHLNKSYCSKNQIVLIGDSITDFYNHYELFDTFSEKTGLKIYNRGISGDTTNRLYERLYDNALCIEPSFLVCLIGTNDLSFGADGEYVADKIKSVILETKKHCPECKIAIQSVYPVVNNKKRNNKRIKALNELIKALCEHEKVDYIDLYDALCDSEGKLNSEYSYDGLHLNVKGYEVTTEAISKFLMG